ncbi:MAG: hypothetical protein HUU54_15895 [Ignavibacteriaceae bacterium]|nr:hypothetical protein [Ignavibacteriaceae bacterium]
MLHISDKLSGDFLSFIEETANIYLHPSKTEELIKLLLQDSLRFPQTSVTESNFRRLIDNVLDKGFVINGLLNFDYYREIIFAVSSHSNYLTDIVVRNPEFLSWILELSPLHADFSRENLRKEISESLSRFRNFDTKLRRLKSIKRREILRIGLRDILGIKNLKEITAELSGLAGCIADELFLLCLSEIKSKNRIEGEIPDYAMVALGKFGGYELNYSSDIDLILFFEENTELNERIDVFGIYSDAIHLFINTASQPDESGFLYRVDFRLRPDGRTSPLCRTLRDYISYYDSRGEYWERQMLIKSGFVSGSQNLCDKFFNYLSHFVYPSSFNQSPVAQIKKIRQDILSRQSSDDNIKLSEGGIRDIEFGIQVLQLINGGKNPRIRSGNTLEAIDKLTEAGLLTNEEQQHLTESYIFYRKIEHYLQLMNDRQTHTLPKEPELLYRLSFYLGFASPGELLSEVDAKRDVIKSIYRSIIGDSPAEEKSNKLAELKFTDVKKAEKNYRFLSEGKGLLEQKSFDTITLDLFKEIEYNLLGFLKTSAAPDTVLENFVRIIKTGSVPSVWYRLFRNGGVFHSFLVCCERAGKFINILASDSALMEIYISGKFFEPVNGDDDFSLNTLQLFAVLSSQLALRIITAADASRILTLHCYSIIRHVFSEFSPPDGYRFEYAVIALGSASNQQMNFNSDVDLIFIAGDENTPENLQEIFTASLARIRELCKPLKVDCRLRPEGKSSPLVWTITGYEKYLQTRARVWEFQSLTKTTFVSGSEGLFGRFVDSAVSALRAMPEQLIIREVLQMRKSFLTQSGKSLISGEINIKKSRGGIADTEFLIQLLILINPHYFKSLMGKNTRHSLTVLASYGLITPEDSESLITADTFLRETETAAQVVFDISTAAGKERLNSAVMKRFLHLRDDSDLLNEIKRNIGTNSDIIEKNINRFLSE